MSSSTNNCKQYSTFPSEIFNGVPNINAGYSLDKYTFNYNNLSTSQKTNAKEKCIAQYIDNYFTLGKNIDISFQTSTRYHSNINYFNNNDDGYYYTYISADPKEVFELYIANGIIKPPVYTSS